MFVQALYTVLDPVRHPTFDPARHPLLDPARHPALARVRLEDPGWNQGNERRAQPVPLEYFAPHSMPNFY